MKLIVDFASKDSCLDGSAIGNGLIWVDAPVGFLAIEELLDQLLDFRDSCRAAHEYDFINLAALQSRVLHDLLNGLHGVLKEVVVKLFKLCSGESLLKIDSIDEIVDEDLDLGLR